MSEERTLEDSLLGIERICRGLRIVLVIVMAILAVVDFSIIAISVTSFAEAGLSAVLYECAHCASVFVILVLAFLGLTDVVKGESPFTLKQAGRFKIAGFLFLVILLVELFFPADLTLDVLPNAAAVAEINVQSSELPETNMIVLLLSLTSFCMSFIFRYGVLLQQGADDIV